MPFGNVLPHNRFPSAKAHSSGKVNRKVHTLTHSNENLPLKGRVGEGHSIPGARLRQHPDPRQHPRVLRLLLPGGPTPAGFPGRAPVGCGLWSFRLVSTDRRHLMEPRLPGASTWSLSGACTARSLCVSSVQAVGESALPHAHTHTTELLLPAVTCRLATSVCTT